MKLHLDKEIFNDLITLTTEYVKIPEIAIKRDYFIVLLLKRLHDSEYAEECVFKGGTSLSKCYPGSINRFSEDIDLLKTFKIAIEFGSFSLTGQDIDLKRNRIVIIDSGNFILAGIFINCGDKFIQQLTNNVRAHLHNNPYRDIRIIKGKLGAKAACWGAAYMAQEMLFNPKQQILS